MFKPQKWAVSGTVRERVHTSAVRTHPSTHPSILYKQQYDSTGMLFVIRVHEHGQLLLYTSTSMYYILFLILVYRYYCCTAVDGQRRMPVLVLLYYSRVPTHDILLCVPYKVVSVYKHRTKKKKLRRRDSQMRSTSLYIHIYEYQTLLVRSNACKRLQTSRYP